MVDSLLGGNYLAVEYRGNIAKTLHVSMSGKIITSRTRWRSGTNVYIETAYITDSLTREDGVFRVSAYVRIRTSIKTKTVAFNIICAVAEEAGKPLPLITVGEGHELGVENTLFDSPCDGG